MIPDPTTPTRLTETTFSTFLLLFFFDLLGFTGSFVSVTLVDLVDFAAPVHTSHDAPFATARRSRRSTPLDGRTLSAVEILDHMVNALEGSSVVWASRLSRDQIILVRWVWTLWTPCGGKAVVPTQWELTYPP
jgi:hypothetical protein